MKNWFFLIAGAVLLFSCSPGNTFKSKLYNYKLDCPPGYILLTPEKGSAQAESFKEQISKEGGKEVYLHTEGAFYNPASQPPFYNLISISTIPKYMDVKKIDTVKEELEYTLSIRMSKEYDNVQILRSGLELVNGRNTWRIDFRFSYQNVFYVSSNVIVQGDIFGNPFINSIVREENQNMINPIRNQVISSYRK